MVKRIVDTSFWTDMQVIDSYSVEDRYFSLYLMTNDKSTQLGIYPLPKKIVSFETGFTTDVVQVLLERFSKNYKRIIYSEKTQEVAILHSLQYSILKGGKPVSDLLERELSKVKDGGLILATYNEMHSFWELSKRAYDKTIKELFEKELSNRGLISVETQNDNQNQKQNDNEINNDNDNHNHNEESWATNRGTNRGTNRELNQHDSEELEIVERYVDFLKKSKPEFQGKIDSTNILLIFYELMIGEVHPHIENQLNQWLTLLPKSLVVEALHRSVHANSPILYASTIIDNWKKKDVKTYKDVVKLDKNYSRDNK